MGCCQPKYLCLPITPVPPPPIQPGYALKGPIAGVVNGQQANAGEVGEFIQRSVTGTVNIAATGVTTVTTQIVTLPPGDWDVEALLAAPLIVDGAAAFVLNPSIQGASSNMQSGISLPGAVAGAILSTNLLSQRTQVLIQSNTTLSFDLSFVNLSSNPVNNAPYTFTVNSRRMR